MTQIRATGPIDGRVHPFKVGDRVKLHGQIGRVGGTAWEEWSSGHFPVIQFSAEDPSVSFPLIDDMWRAASLATRLADDLLIEARRRRRDGAP